MNDKPVLDSDGKAQSTSAETQGQAALATITSGARRLREALGRVIVGQNEAIDLALVTLLAGGHALIEGVPGVGKTLLVKALARAVAGEFQRIQFTPDLMPADITGTSVFDLKTQEFRLVRGPIFTNFLLADEINRAPAKTQSALLEAMQERQVTIDRETCALPPVFIVFATQNPIEHQGTYPLPEAQKDRFLLKIRMGYPAVEDENELARLVAEGEAPERRLAEDLRAPVLQPGELEQVARGDGARARQRGHKQLHRQSGSADTAARRRLGWRRAESNARVTVGIAGACCARRTRFHAARRR